MPISTGVTGASTKTDWRKSPGKPSVSNDGTDLHPSAFANADKRPSPNLNHGAGIDVSPAVRDYLALRSLDLVAWRFIEQAQVPAGPWSLYNRPQIVEANR